MDSNFACASFEKLAMPFGPIMLASAPVSCVKYCSKDCRAACTWVESLSGVTNRPLSWPSSEVGAWVGACQTGALALPWILLDMLVMPVLPA
ncbi:hypothetical protein D3C71_1471550 [compost metagenome]